MNQTATRVEPLDRLPHRPPFRFLTKLASWVPGEEAKGEWQIKGDEDFLRGHFPGNPIVPGVLIGESLAQLAGVVAIGGEASGKGGRLVQINVRFDAPVVPPATIVLWARKVKDFEGLKQFEVAAESGGVRVARGELTLAEVVEKDKAS